MNKQKLPAEFQPDIFVPSKDVTDVYLLPTDVIERLDEYSQDQNLFFTTASIIFSIPISIICNWSTASPLITTPASIFLGLITTFISVGCFLWGIKLRKRANRIKAKFYRKFNVEVKN